MADPVADLAQEIERDTVDRLVPTVQRIFGVTQPFVAARLLREFFAETGVFIVPEPGLVLPSGHVVTEADLDALTMRAGRHFWAS